MNKIIKEDTEIILKDSVNFKKLKDKTVLVTGASGMIGKYLCFTLLQANIDLNLNINVLALIRNKEKAEKTFGDINKYDGKLKILLQSVNDKISYDGKIDYIVHAASNANPESFKKDPTGTILANTIGTINTIELAKENNAQFCYISSLEVYGDMDNIERKIVETDFGRLNSIDLRSCYPESKRLSENIAIAYNYQYLVDTKIVRLSHIYGPGMEITDPRVQTYFMKSVISDEDIILKTDGSTKRTYTYISDAISAILYIMLNSNDIVYNVADEKSIISIRNLAKLIIKCKDDSKSKLVIQIDEKNIGWSSTKQNILDCTKLYNLGWNPKIDLKKGFKRTINYYIQNI